MKSQIIPFHWKIAARVELSFDRTLPWHRVINSDKVLKLDQVAHSASIVAFSEAKNCVARQPGTVICQKLHFCLLFSNQDLLIC